MKIRTLIELQTRLDADFGWRIKELATIKSAVKTSQSSVGKRTTIRAGVPLAYAHWEGFIKNSSQYYIQYVASQRVKFTELANNFVYLGLRKHLSEMSQGTGAKRGLEIVDFLREKMSERFNADLGSAINTESNLSSVVFCNIATSVGIQTAKYEPRFHFIDSSLLRARNHIAHGEFLEIDNEGFVDIVDGVLYLLRSYKDDVENLASLRAFYSLVSNPN